MVNYLSIVKPIVIGFLIGGGIFYWGFVNDGYVRMIIAFLVFFASIKMGIDKINFATELEQWLSKNEGKLVLFYPTKKPIQDKIRTDFIPHIPHKILEVYYEKSKLKGDLKWSVVIEIMKWNPSIKIHQPVIFKIVNQHVVMEKLDELTRIETEDLNLKVLLDRIEKVKNSV